MKKTLARNKVRLTRGYSYVNTIGIPFLVAREMERMTVAVSFLPNIDWVYFLVVALITIWLIGYIDTKTGFLGEEQRYIWKQNPEWMGRVKDK